MSFQTHSKCLPYVVPAQLLCSEEGWQAPVCSAEAGSGGGGQAGPARHRLQPHGHRLQPSTFHPG